MAITKSQLLVGFASIVSALAGKVAQASEEIRAESSIPMDESLVDQMIRHNTFKVDANSNEIQIDQKQLLRSLQQELQIKLQNKNIDPGTKDIYKKLIENLKPGSFGEKNNEYSTMDFGKPT